MSIGSCVLQSSIVSRLCRAGVCLEACTLRLNERILHTCNTAGTSSELKIDLYVCVVWKLQTQEGAQQRWDGYENTRQQPIRPTNCWTRLALQHTPRTAPIPSIQVRCVNTHSKPRPIVQRSLRSTTSLETSHRLPICSFSA
ncbi:unnamed protein product, partial [Ectocarpus sp. 8 AP-2014]